MKNFLCTISQQDPTRYEKIVYANPCDNPALECNAKINNPIFALIRNKAEKGEKIRITAIKPDYVNCNENYKTFVTDVEELKKEIGFEYEISLIDTPFSERIDDHLNLFEMLLDTFNDNDEIYADITFGSKPIPIIALMALTYAYRFRKAFIENITYGQAVHDPKGGTSGSMYDVSALFYMNSTLNVINDSSDPKEFIKSILNF